MAQSAGQIAVLALVAGAVIGAAVALGALGLATPGADSPDEANSSDTAPTSQQPTSPDPVDQSRNTTESIDNASILPFGTTEAFRAYVRAAQRNPGPQWTSAGPRFRVGTGIDIETGGDQVAAVPTDGDGGSTAVNRIGNTNVQVEGLAEPDTVTTDGQNFYYAPEHNRFGYGPRPVEPPVVRPDDGVARTDVYIPPRQEPDRRTHVVDASEPADPEALTNINATGKLIQTGDTLVVFDRQDNQITGYDVSDAANPVESWSLPLEDQLVTARETGGQLYLVTETRVGPGTDCPIEPLGSEEAIACGDIYAPDTQTSASAAYTAFSIDAASGTVDDSVSMMGTGSGTVVYMSHDNLYLTYTTGVSRSDLRASWAAASDVVPEGLADRIAEIHSYDLSEGPTRDAMRIAVNQWTGSNSELDRATLREDFADYQRANRENLTTTGIVRVGVDGANLQVGQAGTVPGEPLNQFALDEYQGTLRITTTIPRVAGAESDNRLYVLGNESLDREANISGLGHDQRVYSVRYTGDTAYVVTYRQIDPFYVIDFEEPTEPKLQGELKLPGFSSYLHPLDDDHVLGIGEENGQVKAVTFDVSDPTDPTIDARLQLDSFWSAIDDTHHAFTIDRRHEVFFLPAGNSGKIVSYADGDLEIVKEVSANTEVSRARYVNDYLYVFAGSEITVLDETSWEETTTLSLGSDSDDE